MRTSFTSATVNMRRNWIGTTLDNPREKALAAAPLIREICQCEHEYTYISLLAFVTGVSLP